MHIVATLFLLAAAFAAVYGFVQSGRAGFVVRHRERPIGTIHGGVLAIRGRARPVGAGLRSPIGGAECVWFRYVVEEYRPDFTASANSIRRGSWHTVDRGEQATDFLVEDGAGVALVHPSGAVFEVQTTVSNQPMSSSAGFQVGPLTVGSHERRYTEAWIAVGQEVHVVGGARPLHAPPGAPAAAASIAFSHEAAADAFLVSDRAPEQLVSALRMRAYLSWAGAGVAVAVGAALLLMGRRL